jgi:PAS domain S-box-containing protein
MNEGLIMVDTELRIVYCNVRFEQMMGYTKEEIINKPYTKFFDEKNRKIVEERWQQRVAGEDPSYEIAFLKKDGTALFTIVTPKVMMDDKGAFIGSFATVTNITEQKILQSQLFQAHKLEGIGQLAAGIAHEINTPTQYVSSNTRFLSDAFSDLQELLKAYQELANELKSEGQKAEKLKAIDELMQDLDYEFLAEEIPKALEANNDGLARIAKIVLSIKEFAHPGREVKEPTDINRVVSNTITVAKNEWKYVADVDTDLDGELPLVSCVVSELNQVILNLIVNAAQAIGEVVGSNGEEKGKILVSTLHKDEWIEIRISDNGPGISKEIRDRIFEPFFTTKDPGKGTGQGLAIAYRSIVNNHKGRLDVTSEPGKGTTFTIALPLLSSGDEAES